MTWRTRRRASAKVGFPDRSVRMTTVFMKQPIMELAPGALRVTTGVPTVMSSWPE